VELEEDEEELPQTAEASSSAANGVTAASTSGEAAPDVSAKPQKDSLSIASLYSNQNERVVARCEQIADDGRRKKEDAAALSKKEEQECTFAPKILPRGSPRTCTRHVDPGDTSRWSQRAEQRMRNQRLKQVEAQVYADVTLKPKISRFAQAWSQKQQEVLPDGRQPGTVFERLYQAAMQARDSRLEREGLQELAEEAAARQQAEGTSVSSRQNATKRALPTPELLYTDALDRRERLKNLAEHLQAMAPETYDD